MKRGHRTGVSKQENLSPFGRFVRAESSFRGQYRNIAALVRAANDRGIVATTNDVWSLQDRHRTFQQYLWPKMISEFVAAYSAQRAPSSVLDPHAGLGTPLLTLAEQVKPARSVALCPRQEVLAAARILDAHGSVEWLSGELDDHERIHAERFDLIVCFPPIGMRSVKQRMDGTELQLNDSPGHLLIAQLSPALIPDGIAVFVVSPKFLRDRRNNCVRKRLTEFGLTLTAYVSVPHAQGLHPGVGLAFIKKGKSDTIFAGTLSENEDRNSALLRNLVSRTDGASISAGRLVASEGFVNPEMIAAEDRIHRIAAKRGMTPQRLGRIARQITFLRHGATGFQEQADALYLPRYPLGRVVTEREHLTGKTRNCMQVVLDQNVADTRYVAGFFNSPAGRTIRDAVCAAHGVSRALTRRAVEELVVLLPDKNTQLRVIETDTKAASLISEVRELRGELWNQPRGEARVRSGLRAINRKESFPNWLDALPFPLASILWAYHAAEGDDQRQYQHLDHFFEALSQFLATLMLSAFRTNATLFDREWTTIRENLEQQSLSITRATIGTWLAIAERLFKRARRMLQDDDEANECFMAFRTADRSVLDALLSKRLISTTREANALRNEWRGHGGIVGRRTAYELRLRLTGLLNDVRECLGTVWNRYQLVRAGEMRMLDDGEYRIRLETVMGRSYPFVARESVLEEPLRDGQLYFLGEAESRALPLIPFVTLRPSPDEEQNACYFFSRANGSAIRLVSYHFEPAPSLHGEFVETREILDELSAK